MYKLYVDENLRELREKAGLTGALITDTDTSTTEPRPGKEL